MYRIGYTRGADVTDPRITTSLDADGARRYTIIVAYKDHDYKPATRTVTIIQPFDAAVKNVDNPLARLDGILVNGRQINGWDPDVLDYTITATGTEPYRVEPQASSGQSVSAGDVRQSAYTTVQEWTVSRGGQTRTYTVTVVRPHTQPTLDEAFTPPTPMDAQPDPQMRPEGEPGSMNLESVGYLLGGEYHAVTGDMITIPEHGRLAWQAYRGQSVVMNVERVHGMTWRYTLNILSAMDAQGNTRSATRTLTVTYLTRDTHRAALTGVQFDGRSLDGFDPNRREYTVRVDNPDRYVITPLFDKMTGMSVSTHKRDHDAIVTVRSADGLTTVRYTFHVTANPLLADTGVTGIIGIALGALILAGIGFMVTGFLRRRNTRGRTMIEDGRDKPENQ